jgi:poly(beta-D-mannuronate) lyase
MPTPRSAIVLFPLLFTLPLRAAEYTASSAAEVAKLSGGLKPGDTLVLKDGTWKDQKVILTAHGSASAPITIRSQSPGGALFTGPSSSLAFDGEYLLISGIHLKDFGVEGADGKGTGDGIAILASHSRLTDCAIENGKTHFMVHLIGTDNRMDHCFLAGKTSGEPTFQIEVPFDRPDNDLIDHNHFGHRAPLGRNGGETIRVGYSWQSMNSSKAIVEHNLFDRCDGEIEIISSKSCDNIYRYNTFLDCAGMLTLRHGNRCVVDSNFFIAHHKKDSGGIRIIGEDHVIVNNYIDGVDKGAFWITSGVPNSKLIQYICARRTIIAHNTVVDSAGPYLDLAAGLGGAGRKIKPDQLTIADNLFSVGKGAELIKNQGNEGDYNTWIANLVAPGTGVSEHAGVKAADLKLEKDATGIWRPTKDSPAVGAAEPFPTPSNSAQLPQYLEPTRLTTDIDGQPRPESKKTIGCDEASDAPVTNRPLTAKDVGPTWMERSAGEDK